MSQRAPSYIGFNLEGGKINYHGIKICKQCAKEGRGKPVWLLDIIALRSRRLQDLIAAVDMGLSRFF
jgi:hypothetical protein